MLYIVYYMIRSNRCVARRQIWVWLPQTAAPGKR